MLLGKLGKYINFVTIFVYVNDEIPPIFSNLELGAAKTRACILRLSVLKDNLAFHPLFCHY